ncbi:MAG: hypothetical protein GXY03_00335 [Solirubrobacterales bacterium]|nr:hypothetical protein [Solirubrobacterales bacterium]
MAARPGRGPARPHRKAARRDGTLEFMGRERERDRGEGHPAESPDLDHARLLADYDAAMEVALAEVEHAFLIADGDWAQRMGAAVARLLTLAARNHDQARLCTVGVFAAGPDGIARRDAWLRRFAALRDAGLAAGDGEESSRLGSAMATGALFELVRAHASDGRLDRLEDALPTALLVVLGPSIGRDAALRLAG